MDDRLDSAHFTLGRPNGLHLRKSTTNDGIFSNGGGIRGLQLESENITIEWIEGVEGKKSDFRMNNER